MNFGKLTSPSVAKNVPVGGKVNKDSPDILFSNLSNSVEQLLDFMPGGRINSKNSSNSLFLSCDNSPTGARLTFNSVAQKYPNDDYCLIHDSDFEQSDAEMDILGDECIIKLNSKLIGESDSISGLNGSSSDIVWNSTHDQETINSSSTSLHPVSNKSPTKSVTSDYNSVRAPKRKVTEADVSDNESISTSKTKYDRTHPHNKFFTSYVGQIVSISLARLQTPAATKQMAESLRVIALNWIIPGVVVHKSGSLLFVRLNVMDKLLGLSPSDCKYAIISGIILIKLCVLV
jgi:hypothetical protein